jgi:transposase
LSWRWKIWKPRWQCHVEEDAEDRTAKRSVKPRGANRGALPKHLPLIEEIIEPDSLTCACGGCLHCIGEDASERLDIVPAQFRVIVTRRPKDACRSCTDGVVQDPAPARLILGGMPTEAIVVHVLVSKYADHLPLYRRARSTVARALISTAPPLGIGSVGPPSHFAPSTRS